MDRYGGIDIGGTSIKYGIVSNGKVYSKKTIHRSQRADRFIPYLRNAIRDLIANEVKGIGFGFPGHISQHDKVFYGGPNLKIEVSMREIMEEEDFENFNIDNDGNVAALAEYELFYKEKYKNFIFLSFGTGIGGGIINDSKLIRGQGAAGELGHILISNDPSLEKCPCGLTGCFESLASARQWTEACINFFDTERLARSRHLLRRWKKQQKSELYKFLLKGKNLSKGSALFNPSIPLTELQIEKRDEFVSHISQGLISLYELFDNQVFVIGGSFTDDENNLVELLNEKIGKVIKFKLGWRSFPEIHIAQLKSDAGIIGASFLVK